MRPALLALALCTALLGACAAQNPLVAVNSADAPAPAGTADASASVAQAAAGDPILVIASQPVFFSPEHKVVQAEVAWLWLHTLDVGNEESAEALNEQTYRNELAALCALKGAGFAPESCGKAEAGLMVPADKDALKKAMDKQRAVLEADELSKAILVLLDQTLATAIQDAETATARSRDEKARMEAQILQAERARSEAELAKAAFDAEAAAARARAQASSANIAAAEAAANAARAAERKSLEAKSASDAAQADAAKQASELAEALRKLQLAEARLEAAQAAKKAEFEAYRKVVEAAQKPGK